MLLFWHVLIRNAVWVKTLGRIFNLEVPHQVLSGRRPPIHDCMQEWCGEHGSSEVAQQIGDIVTDCWAENPKDRPTRGIVLKRLTACLEESERRSDVVGVSGGSVQDGGSGQSLRQVSGQSVGSEASQFYTA